MRTASQDRNLAEFGTNASGLVSVLYDSVGKPDGWATFVDALARSYSGGKATLMSHDCAAEGDVLLASGQWAPEQNAQYKQHYGAINPWLRPLGKINRGLKPVGERPVGLVRTSKQVLPRAELLKTESYNDFLRPAQVDEGVAVTVQKDGSRSILLTVLFPQATAERDIDTVGRLQRLVPHIVRVVQLNRQLAGLEARALAAETVLDGLVTAMIVVNATGHVAFMNAAAERIITADDGPKVARFALDAVTPGEGKLLRQLISSAVGIQGNVAASPGGVMRISRRSGRASYEVLVAPISGTTLGPGFDGPLAAVFIRDPEPRIVTPVDRLKHLYSLTSAEARLMQALLAGDTLDTIVERTGVGRETLRSQLKSVFLKTGSSSQIELIRLGLRGLAAFKG